MEHAADHAHLSSNLDPSTPNRESKPIPPKPKPRSRRKTADPDDDPSKRRCVSSACVACRKRKSKCDGNTPACAACSQVYGTECIYDPGSDHRRKGVYRADGVDTGDRRGEVGEDDGVGGVAGNSTAEGTLEVLVSALLNLEEGEAMELVREMRGAESLDAVAERVGKRVEVGMSGAEEGEQKNGVARRVAESRTATPGLEREFYGKMGDLRLDEGSVRYIGGTSNLIHITQDEDGEEADQYVQQEDPITSWTSVTDDPELVVHLLNMYFTWHYTYFTTLSKSLFYRDFMLGRPPSNVKRKTHYCTSLLVNAMLALGCHFTSHRGARADPDDSATAGDHFFKEAKRLILENDEHERPRLTTVQALALMSVREAGCGREAKGWVYSGMSFRMGLDMGLNLDTGRMTNNKHVNGNEAEEDVRRITFWGCYLFDKCWSNYLGRLPQIPSSIVTAPKAEVFPDEDSANWSPYSDSGYTHAHAQPARTRAVALQITKLCEISNDLMKNFYNPSDLEKNRSKAAELKMLSDIHRRLETWRAELPKELEPREGGLSSVLTMHMFFQILYIHLFRPFLQYTAHTSPLPSTVSPRKICTAAASQISKLMRLYKRSHGLRQICNICVYIMHSACTIHLLNLPEKGARRDIVHGVKHLEEIAEGWLCARRSLRMVSWVAAKWGVELPEEAARVLERATRKFGVWEGEGIRRTPTWNPASKGQYHGNALGANSGVGAQQAGMVTMPVENFHTSPPYEPNPMPFASTETTPPQQQPQSGYVTSASNIASPSDMFGGIEQLLHESNDWTYRDQAQLATGFENWTGIDVDPAVWGSGGGGAMGQEMPAGGTSNGQGAATAMAYTGLPSGTETFVGMNGAGNGQGFMAGAGSGYNEEEWYQ